MKIQASPKLDCRAAATSQPRTQGLFRWTNSFLAIGLLALMTPRAAAQAPDLTQAGVIATINRSGIELSTEMRKTVHAPHVSALAGGHDLIRQIVFGTIIVDAGDDDIPVILKMIQHSVRDGGEAGGHECVADPEQTRLLTRDAEEPP